MYSSLKTQTAEGRETILGTWRRFISSLEHVKLGEIVGQQSSPVHINDLWEFELLVYLFRTTKLGVEFKS